MSEFAVIAQNDESVWDDVKGDLYHYPATYQAILTPGCRVIYYKGKMLDRKYASERLSPHPHYFGVTMLNLAANHIAQDEPLLARGAAQESIEALEGTSSQLELAAGYLLPADSEGVQ